MLLRVIAVTYIMGVLSYVGASGAGEDVMLARPSLGAATMDVIRSLPDNIRLTAKHVHICCAEVLDKSFLKWTWSTPDVPLSLWKESEWKELMARSTYKDGATQVLVGDMEWLVHTLQLIRKFITTTAVNIQKVQWILVSTEPSNGSFPESVEANIPEMSKLLLLQERRGRGSRRSLNRSLSGPHVSIHIAQSPGDGSVVLAWAGSWSEERGLLLQFPLQAKPAEHFHGRDLRLTTVHKPRVFEVEGHSTLNLDVLDGYVAELMRILQGRFNFSAVISTTNTFGSLQENGSWNGMMSFLTKGEVDLSPLDFSPSWDRAQAVDFSEWFSTDDVIVISKAPQTLVKPFLVFEVFTLWVWVAIVAAAVITGTILWALEKLIRHFSGRVDTKSGSHEISPSLLQTTVASTLKLFVMQGSRSHVSSSTARTVAMCFYLVVISVVAVYQGYIIAFLTVPRRAAPIDSAFDLMDRLPKVKPVVRKNTVYYHFVVNFEPYAPIASNLEFQPDTFLNTWEFFKMIHQGKFALIDTYSSGVGRAASYETKGEECHFYVSKNVLKGDLDVMAHRQNSIFRQHVDRALTQLRSFGIIEMIKRQYYSTSCERQFKKRETMALGFTQVQGVFYLLVVGLAISLFSFILELTIYLLKPREKTDT